MPESEIALANPAGRAGQYPCASGGLAFGLWIAGFEFHGHGGQKQKTHCRSGSGWLINSGEWSKPDCRAGQQRVGKQQVQIAIHGCSIHRLLPPSSLAVFEKRGDRETPIFRPVRSLNDHPNWRSATVSETSRRSVASQKIGRVVQAHCMVNVAAAGFSAQPRSGATLHPTRLESVSAFHQYADYVLWVFQPPKAE